MLYPRMTVDSKTELYGLFGNPVRHSLSPLIHNTMFECLKMNAVYMAFQVEKELLGLAFEGIRSLGIRGVNITIPHKENAINFIDEIPEDVDRAIGAINTVVNRDGRLFGYNTDRPGFLTALKEELNLNPEGKTCLVLGAGGAGRGVTFALAHARAERILIYDMVLERAQGLVDYLETHFPETEIEALDSLDAVSGEKISLVVNASNCGMKLEDPAPFDLKNLKEKVSVFDLIYSPVQTKLLKTAKELGLPCANGLGMLAAQAALSFELWTGVKEGVREKMLETLKKCQF